MEINEFIREYKNHPVLFVGTGFSLRYLKQSFTWENLLKNICYELKGNHEYYYDLKEANKDKNNYSFEKIASDLEEEFNEALRQDRNGKFKNINDIFYNEAEKGNSFSRFKIYIAKLLESVNLKEEMGEEISELTKIRKNIGSIITTNYDKSIEKIFEFNPLVGNNILLSNPYGSLYKIHGCVDMVDKIIITNDDYKIFMEKYELIRAQLLSLFIHNPIIFLGYNIGDPNIKNILKTIFTYIDVNSNLANEIRKNFLLVEYEKDNMNIEITEHDIDMGEFGIIRINKLKTDNFKELYKSLSSLQLPISAMDIRKVQTIVGDIYKGSGKIKVNITEDLGSLENSDKILAIGTSKTISYSYHNATELLGIYFKIIEEENDQILDLIDKINISKNQYFPIYGFNKINSRIMRIENLKSRQNEKIKNLRQNFKIDKFDIKYTSIKEIEEDEGLGITRKEDMILLGILEKRIKLEDTELYLRNFKKKDDTFYKKILSCYDYIKYKDN